MSDSKAATSSKNASEKMEPKTPIGSSERQQTSTPAGHQTLHPDDFYMEGPYLVFTAAYHLRRGTCCNSNCRHCPYK